MGGRPEYGRPVSAVDQLGVWSTSFGVDLCVVGRFMVDLFVVDLCEVDLGRVVDLCVCVVDRFWVWSTCVNLWLLCVRRPAQGGVLYAK